MAVMLVNANTWPAGRRLDGMFSFFCDKHAASRSGGDGLPDLEPVVMAQVITVDPNPMDEGTSGDDTFYPAVMGLCVVVKSTLILGVWSLVLLSCGKGCIPL